VVQTTTTTNTTTTSSSFVNFSALNTSITPKFSTSKILVIVSMAIQSASGNFQTITIFRGTTSGTDLSAGSGFSNDTSSTGLQACHVGITCLDSPATTSATTYTVGMKTGGGTCYAQIASSTSTITLMEIAG
jgi:hypothetical protein